MTAQRRTSLCKETTADGNLTTACRLRDRRHQDGRGGRITAVLILAFLSVPAAPAAPVATAGAAAQAGAAVYKDKCIGCHGADGSANTPLGKALKVQDLRRPEVQALTDVQLVTVITNGKGKMPPLRGKLTAAQIDQVVAYVRSLSKPK